MISYGTDPECFFSQGNAVYPAGMVLPHKIMHSMWGNLYVDGAALELQPDASADYNQVVDNIRHLFEYALNIAHDIPIEIEPVLPIDLKYCQGELAIFGCDPDLSAWGEECLPAQVDAAKHPWRYGGCHLHFGMWDDIAYLQNNAVEIIQMLDRTVGLASMILGNNKDIKRRELYGRPGIYRIQPWGIEYRTPSNVLLSSPELMRFIFKLGGDTIMLVKDYGADKLLIIPDDVILGVLRSSDIETAKTLYELLTGAINLPPLPEIPNEWRGAWGL